MALRLLAGRIGAAVAAAGVGLSGAAHCDSKEPAGPSFDPEALERGAAALREINKSPYARKVLVEFWNIRTSLCTASARSAVSCADTAGTLYSCLQCSL